MEGIRGTLHLGLRILKPALRRFGGQYTRVGRQGEPSRVTTEAFLSSVDLFLGAWAWDLDQPGHR